MMNSFVGYNPYNPYAQGSYGSPQNQYQMLEQQKRDIENRMSALQGQMQQPMNQPLTINNNIVPSQNQENNKYDFKGMFLDDEDKIKDIYDTNLPIIIMSSKENTFRIKEVNGKITKYKFEEVKEDEKMVNNGSEENNQQIEIIKKQIEQQQIAINQIVGLLQTRFSNSGVNTQDNQKVSQIAQNKENEETEKPKSTTTRTKKGAKENG